MTVWWWSSYVPGSTHSVMAGTPTTMNGAWSRSKLASRVVAGRAEGRQRRERLLHGRLEVRPPVELDAARLPGAGVHDEHGAQPVELLLVRRDVGARAERGLLLAREEREPDRAPRREAERLQDPRRLEHGGHARAVVVGALRRVPRVEVRADEHDLVLRAPPGRSATTLRSLYGLVSNVFFTSSASFTGPFARSRRSSSASSFATEIAGSGPFG